MSAVIKPSPSTSPSTTPSVGSSTLRASPSCDYFLMLMFIFKSRSPLSFLAHYPWKTPCLNGTSHLRSGIRAAYTITVKASEVQSLQRRRDWFDSCRGSPKRVERSFGRQSHRRCHWRCRLFSGYLYYYDTTAHSAEHLVLACRLAHVPH